MEGIRTYFEFSRRVPMSHDLPNVGRIGLVDGCPGLHSIDPNIRIGGGSDSGHPMRGCYYRFESYYVVLESKSAPPPCDLSN